MVVCILKTNIHFIFFYFLEKLDEKSYLKNNFNTCIKLKIAIENSITPQQRLFCATTARKLREKKEENGLLNTLKIVTNCLNLII